MECGVLLHKKGPSSSKKRDMRYEILQLKEKCQSALIRERWTFPPFPQNHHYRGWVKQMHHLYPTVSPLSPVQTLVLKHRRTFLPLSLSFSLTPALFLFMLTISRKILLLDSNFILRRGSFDHRIHLQTVARLPLDGLAISGKDLTHLFCVVNTSISWLNKTFFWMKKDNNNKKKKRNNVFTSKSSLCCCMTSLSGRR